MDFNNPSTPYRVKSLLDTDLYKFTMQQAVLRHFPDEKVTYKFTHRDKDIFFSHLCFEEFQKSILGFKEIYLTPDEKQWLASTCTYFQPRYLDYLEQYRFKPEQVSVNFIPTSSDSLGRIEIEARGLWVETILWEVPLMACLSELYFRLDSTDWSYKRQAKRARQKAKFLIQADCTFSEFGTRRRRSYDIQDIVIASMVKSADVYSGDGKIAGTSNVHFAMKYNMNPMGTIAHEWFMGVAALLGYENANTRALELWEEVYLGAGNLLTALVDTFSSDVFLKEFCRDLSRMNKWKALRHDSGEGTKFADTVKRMYLGVNLDPKEVTIIYSDSLDVRKAIELKRHCDKHGLRCSFGIGTFLTNDFHTKSSKYTQKSKALNIVIKLKCIGGRPCVKISDDLGKNTGDLDAVAQVKRFYGLSHT